MKKLGDSIRRVGLIANAEKASVGRLVRRAADLIRAGQRSVLTDVATAGVAGLKSSTRLSVAELARKVDLLMVFGGDGTMLRVAREIAGSRTPVIGINAGALGFLTDVQAHQLPLALRQIWAGKMELEPRSLIEATGHSGGNDFRETALNDFVISRAASPRLVDLEVTIDGMTLTRYRCDGLIVCTPTGSTAYSLSAGGAIVSPTADVVTLTPICPHTLSNRSVIVSLDAEIRVRALSQRGETQLTADGQNLVRLAYGEEVVIRRSKRSIRLVHLAGSSFYETLRRKLNWSGSSV